MTSEVIILGSARSHGDTRQMIGHIVEKHPMDIIDLKPLNISHFDYEYKNADDDFLPLITKVIKIEVPFMREHAIRNSFGLHGVDELAYAFFFIFSNKLRCIIACKI
jgi:hypothetical protein